METISNVVNSASKAIWGEQNPSATAGNETLGQEPVSGLQGKGTTEDPFDQGNAENPADPTGKSHINQTAPTTTETSTSTTSTTSPTPDSTTSHKPTPFTPIGSETSMNPSTATTGEEPKPLENTEGTGVTGASAQKYAPKGGDVVPSESSNPGVPPASGAAPSQKQQGADRPYEAPEDDAEAILKTRDPNDHSGEPMRVHDGSEIPNTQEERRTSKVGLPGGQEHGKEPKGTGDQWVKTSGLHADGGDFDATKPGAGREADRILEGKGIHRDAAGAMDNPSAAGDTGANSTKVSKMDKIKDKLHIGHKDK